MLGEEMERFIGPDGREWVRMSADEYWRRIDAAATGTATNGRGHR